jgi:transposase
LPARFVPAKELTVLEDRTPAAAPVVGVELRLTKGRVLWFESNIDDAALLRLVRAVDAV